MVLARFNRPCPVRGNKGDSTWAFFSWLRLGAIETWETDLLPADVIVGTQGDDSLVGTEGDDHIRGRRGNDTLLGGLGLDTLRGGSGDDSLDGGLGADKMVGGLGNDVYLVDDVLDRTFERVGGGVDTVISTVDWMLGPHFENLTLQGGSTSVLNGFGNSEGNVISGTLGRVSIDGMDGNDTLTGAYHISPDATDTLLGGIGDDSIVAGGGQPHNDLMYGGAGNDTLRANGGWIYGDDGDDLLISGPPHGAKPTADRLFGGAGNDTLQGGAYSDGGDGNDLIDTVHGVVSTGGLGNDTIVGEGANPFGNPYEIDSGAGDDLIDVFSFTGVELSCGDGNDVVTVDGLSSVIVDAGSGDDKVTASASAGSASIFGGEGKDALTLIVHSANATISGGAGSDTLTATNTNAQGNLELDGDDGNDRLLATGARFNVLTGGQGSDTFVLSARETENANFLVLTDFESGVDRIGVRGTLPVGDRDLKLEGGVEITGPGGFDASAELVIVSSSIGSMTLSAAAAAIGSANQAYAVGQTSLFVVHRGTESAVLYFQSRGSDAMVTADELSFIGHLQISSTLPGLDDFFLTG